MPRGRDTLGAIWAVAKEPALTPEEKNLWTLYRAYDFHGRGAWPGDDVLAAHMGRSVRSVKQYRKRLMALGYLEQQLRGFRPAIYNAVVPETPPAASLSPDAAAQGMLVDLSRERARRLRGAA